MILSLFVLLVAQAPGTFDFRMGEASLQTLGRSMGYTDTALGTVVASPSKKDPDYYFHWTRDAALVMNTFIRFQAARPDPQMEVYIQNWISLEKFHQRFKTESGKIGRAKYPGSDVDFDLGEPKFNVDLFPYDGPSERPQNDGPALRALAMIRYAYYLIDNNREDEARKLYDGRFPSRSPIKVDLEFISRVWMLPSVDLWEETHGFHFYTRLVQYRALLEGAQLARMLKDPGAADWYEAQAKSLRSLIESHWDKARQLIIPTYSDDQKSFVENKKSNIDSAVILAVLHTRPMKSEDSFFSVTDERVLKTAESIISAFGESLKINQARVANIGAAIGRYPEDQYDGVKKDTQGHAWYLTTAAMAELYFLTARDMKPTNPEKAEMYFEKGESFLRTIEKFANPETLQMSEQFDRETGAPRGARELTWSAAAYLTAMFAKYHPEVK